jgi:hypothetical protein
MSRLIECGHFEFLPLFKLHSLVSLARVLLVVPLLVYLKD